MCKKYFGWGVRIIYIELLIYLKYKEIRFLSVWFIGVLIKLVGLVWWYEKYVFIFNIDWCVV